MNSKPISSFPLAVAVYLLVLGSGCNADVNQPEASSTEAFSNGFTLNGFSLNGFTLNGFTLNGFTLNGFTLNGFSLNGFSLNGFTLNGAALSGTLFSASTNLRPSVSGAELIGALAQISVQAAGEPQPAQYTLRFDNIYVDPNNPGGDVYLYDITYVRSGDTNWTSLCTDAAGNPVPAIPILNYWDTRTGARIDNPNVVTFACVSGALGKCVRLGYRPWAQATRCSRESCAPVSLADYHQACTRLIRADYCGNGTSYTLNGTLIGLYDDLSPPIQRKTDGWNVEGAWTPAGATCVGDARHDELLVKGKFPDCNGDGKPGDVQKCGMSSSFPNSLLVTTFKDGN